MVLNFSKRDSIPTFWLVLIHSSLLCFLKSRSSSMWTPSTLKSSDLSMGSLRSKHFRASWKESKKKKKEYLVSPSIFLGLIVFRNWNFAGLAYKRIFDYNVRACLLLVFRVFSVAVQQFRDLFPSHAINGRPHTY